MRRAHEKLARFETNIGWRKTGGLLLKLIWDVLVVFLVFSCAVTFAFRVELSWKELSLPAWKETARYIVFMIDFLLSAWFPWKLVKTDSGDFRRVCSGWPWVLDFIGSLPVEVLVSRCTMHCNFKSRSIMCSLSRCFPFHRTCID